MRVLIVTPYFKPAWKYGGPVRSVWNLARGLVAAGADVDVATTDADPAGKVNVPAFRSEEGVSIFTFRRLFGNITKINTYYYAPSLSAFLEEKIPQVDIVNLQGLYTWPTLDASRRCARHRIPFLITLRGSLGSWGLRQKVLKKKLYLGIVEKKTVRLASSLHYTVSAEYEEAPEWVKHIPYIIEPNGVEFGPILEGVRWREKFKIPQEDFLIGMVGRVHPKKGIDVLLEAFARIAGAEGIRLVIVGGGEPQDMRVIQNEMVRLGLSRTVTLTGHIAGGAVSEAYAAIDLLALPSREENFGNVVIEALAQNTPVVVSPHVGLSSWVREQKAGEVIPFDTDAWAAYLRELPRRRMDKSPHLRTIAQSHFDYCIVGQRMLEAYRGILAQPPRLIS